MAERNNRHCRSKPSATTGHRVDHGSNSSSSTPTMSYQQQQQGSAYHGSCTPTGKPIVYYDQINQYTTVPPEYAHYGVLVDGFYRETIYNQINQYTTVHPVNAHYQYGGNHMLWGPSDPSLGPGNDLGIDWSSKNHIRSPDVWGEEDFSDENSEPHLPPQISTAQQLTDGLNSLKISHKKPVIVESQFYGVLVDGFYRKHVDKGGYGVILIDRTGIPVGALSGVSKDGAISEYYHTLEGIRAGLKFAIKFGITKVFMACNNDGIAHDVNRCMQSSKRGCYNESIGLPRHPDFDTFCISCCCPEFNVEGRMVTKLMKEIVRIGSPYYYGDLVTKVDKKSNRGADFLAKRREKKKYMYNTIPCEVRKLLSEDGIPYQIRLELQMSVTEDGELYRESN